mmetsp:Transcript_13265/g.20128  ORF Transcript_13265/g.20128 Transcript_13265/m.20128 type:complete len:126 (-) Transcript_13265:101-478(-)
MMADIEKKHSWHINHSHGVASVWSIVAEFGRALILCCWMERTRFFESMFDYHFDMLGDSLKYIFRTSFDIDSFSSLKLLISSTSDAYEREITMGSFRIDLMDCPTTNEPHFLGELSSETPVIFVM